MQNNIILEPERQGLLDAIEKDVGVQLITKAGPQSGMYLDGYSTHYFWRDDGNDVPEELKRKAQQYAARQNWLLCRNKAIENVCGETIFLVKMTPVPLQVGYHVTPRTRVESIQEFGLMPGDPSGPYSDGRFDCDGNIFLWKKLGPIANDNWTAHFWRSKWAKECRFDSDDWVILRVDVRDLPGIKLCKEFFMDCSVIAWYDGKPIPPDPPGRISLEWPPTK